MVRIAWLIGALMVAASPLPADANTIANFALNGITFDDTTGTASGTFSLDLTTGTVGSVSITTPSGTSIPGNGYTGVFFDTFNPSLGEVVVNNPVAMFLDYSLTIDFPGAVTLASLSGLPSFAATGSEALHSICIFGPCPSRSITGGTVDTVSVTTTPLPAALPLFASGLGAIGLIAWRRRRPTVATRAA